MRIKLLSVPMRLNDRRRVNGSRKKLLASAVILCCTNSPLNAHTRMGPNPTSYSAGSPGGQGTEGSRPSFEVASVRLAKPDTPRSSNFSMDVEDTPGPPGGRFSAVLPLLTYIEFAYKIMPSTSQRAAMQASLPRWASTDLFAIDVKAEGHPDKDQTRLMMRTLLAERFDLAVHFETHEAPVLALVLDKPGKIGPRLRPHAEGLACDAKWIAPPDRNAPSVAPGAFLPACGEVLAFDKPNHGVLMGSRNITMEQIAEYLGTLGLSDHPIIDKTGLSGRFDFSLAWMHERNGPSASDSEAQLLGAGEPTLTEALKEQLGLRLRATRADVKALVIDHVEQPSPN